MKRVQVLAATAACVLALGAAAPALATDYNISASANTNFATGVQVNLGPGDYSLVPIGTADGGLYNGWNPNSPQGCEGNACGNQWRWGYSYFSGPTTLMFVGINGNFATDTAAIAAAKASPTMNFGSFNTATSVFTPGSVGNPFLFTIGAPSSFAIFIVDNDGNTSANLGGVSLRITAVPEPATWAMLILGFGMIGLGLRRRRTLALA